MKTRSMRLLDRCLPSGNDTALPLFVVRQRQTCGGCYGSAQRGKAEHLPVAEIAGIEPAPLCELKYKGKWSHSSPVTDRCTTLFCRDCTYSLGSARGTDRRHPVCVCYRPFGTSSLEGEGGSLLLLSAPAGGSGLCVSIAITGTNFTRHEVFTSSPPKFRQNCRWTPFLRTLSC